VGGLPRVHGGLDILVRDVLEEVREVDLLKGARAERRAWLLANDREHRLVIEHCVVEPVQRMDRTRPGGDQADAQATR
jgi:hypothetical protein